MPLEYQPAPKQFEEFGNKVKLLNLRILLLMWIVNFQYMLDENESKLISTRFQKFLFVDVLIFNQWLLLWMWQSQHSMDVLKKVLLGQTQMLWSHIFLRRTRKRDFNFVYPCLSPIVSTTIQFLKVCSIMSILLKSGFSCPGNQKSIIFSLRTRAVTYL